MTMTAAEILASIRVAATSNEYPIADDAAFFSKPQFKNVDGNGAVALRERILVERAIVRRVVTDVLAVKDGHGHGHAYVLNVFDGQKVVVKLSRDLDQIMGALMSTDKDVLIVRRFYEDRASTFVGHIDLIYGNSGWEVIADSSDNSVIKDVLCGAETLAGDFCELMQ